MASPEAIKLLGAVAGFCTTVAFVPQVIKIWKQGGRDLSYGMLSLYLAGVTMWMVYGFLINAQAVFITNVATAILIAFATLLKFVRDRQLAGQPMRSEGATERG